MKTLLTSLVFGFAAIAAQAHDYSAGDVRVIHPFATPTLPGVPNGGAYIVRIRNQGSQADRLVGASTPAAARVELHTMGVDDQGVMRMREVPAIEIAPGAAVEMKPGQGYHLMLMGLKQPLKEGDKLPLTLRFERGGALDVELEVQPRKDAAAAPGAGAASQHKH